MDPKHWTIEDDPLHRPRNPLNDRTLTMGDLDTEDDPYADAQSPLDSYGPMVDPSLWRGLGFGLLYSAIIVAVVVSFVYAGWRVASLLP